MSDGSSRSIRRRLVVVAIVATASLVSCGGPPPLRYAVVKVGGVPPTEEVCFALAGSVGEPRRISIESGASGRFSLDGVGAGTYLARDFTLGGSRVELAPLEFHVPHPTQHRLVELTLPALCDSARITVTDADGAAVLGALVATKEQLLLGASVGVWSSGRAMERVGVTDVSGLVELPRLPMTSSVWILGPRHGVRSVPVSDISAGLRRIVLPIGAAIDFRLATDLDGVRASVGVRCQGTVVAKAASTGAESSLTAYGLPADACEFSLEREDGTVLARGVIKLQEGERGRVVLTAPRRGSEQTDLEIVARTEPVDRSDRIRILRAEEGVSGGRVLFEAECDWARDEGEWSVRVATDDVLRSEDCVELKNCHVVRRLGPRVGRSYRVEVERLSMTTVAIDLDGVSLSGAVVLVKRLPESACRGSGAAGEGHPMKSYWLPLPSWTSAMRRDSESKRLSASLDPGCYEFSVASSPVWDFPRLTVRVAQDSEVVTIRGRARQR